MIAFALTLLAAGAPHLAVDLGPDPGPDLGTPVAALATGAEAPAPPPPGRPGARPAYPQTLPGSWVTRADYPAEALAARATGWTHYVLMVSADGKPLRCAVMDSSGSPQLDTAACQAALTRAAFWPALDRNGQPVPTYYAQRVRWVLPVLPAGRIADAR